jgi:hypothetical protein
LQIQQITFHVFQCVLSCEKHFSSSHLHCATVFLGQSTFFSYTRAAKDPRLQPAGEMLLKLQSKKAIPQHKQKGTRDLMTLVWT